MRELLLAAAGAAFAWVLSRGRAIGASVRRPEPLILPVRSPGVTPPPPAPAAPRQTQPASPFVPVSASGTWSRASLTALCRTMAREAGHDPALIVSIAEHESGLRADAVSPLNRDGTTRDYGLMQVNSQHLGKPGFPRTAAEALDPRVSLRAAFVLLNEAKRHWPGDVERQLAEYNGGYALAARGRPFPNQSYVHGVLARYALHTSESEIAV